MSRIDEDQIRDRLEALSQTGPSQEAADRAMQKVRDALICPNVVFVVSETCRRGGADDRPGISRRASLGA